MDKVEKLIISRFTAFDNATFEFCSGINVLIGANSTGKTHVLKMIYTILKMDHLPNIQMGKQFLYNDSFKNKIEGVFKPESIVELIRKPLRKLPVNGKEMEGGSVFLQNFEGDTQGFTIARNHNDSNLLIFTPDPILHSTSLLFVPSQEFLSLNEGFIAAYTQRESGYDETYYDLAVALNASPLRHREIVEALLEPLKNIIVGKITQEGGKFYITLPEGKLESHLVSEGYRKIAMLMYLIRNGSLTSNGVLIWDEPETNLNPNLVMVIVETLIALAKAGVQIFIATHDYLLSQELSLRAEYDSDVPMRFFALHKPNKRAGVEVETGSTLVEIDNNPIVKEFAAHYDREAHLFNRTTNTNS